MAEEDQKFNLPKIEEKILEFWKQNQIFEKTLRLRSSTEAHSKSSGQGRRKARHFRFYEGPPTANGRPGIHHVLARVFKDIICRYKTMQGFLVERKAGWDTHGLPVELEVEKELGIKDKSEIEKFGIADFNKKCRHSVWRYKDEWERLTERIGFWLDMKNPYITLDNNYIESLWWIIGQIYKKKLLFQDYKVVPYCPRCGTALSSHEVALGYKRVSDPSIYIKFPVRGAKNTYLLVWTTTPWTLPANVAVAVNPFIEYTKFRVNGDFIYSYSTPPYLENQSASWRIEIAEKVSGQSLVGLRYEPLYPAEFQDKARRENAYKVVPADFVSTGEGTGLVHIAPAFGEDDLNLSKKEKLPIIHNVDEKGRFKTNHESRIRNQDGLWRKIEGKFVKDADQLIIGNLKERNLLYHADPDGIEHEYPFCWRCASPLLYYAKKSWFVGMEKLKKQLIENNQKINWVPEHIKEGRFGEWLREVKDWAFSRERYWGTPLPVWICEKCQNISVIGGLEELKKRAERNNK
ncbi:MAG: class I tRNA ligase family protein, partial [bacterium]|nr:class I tRNA ligase family protein [bacterium]